MLKKRIIPIQLLLGNRLVKSVKFANNRDVGDPASSSAVYNSQDADELLILNIDGVSVTSLEPYITEIAKQCFMPLTIGGGITSLGDAAFLICHGADKVLMNTVAYTNPDVISETADRFGKQACVIGIDVKWDSYLEDYVLYAKSGTVRYASEIEEHVSDVIQAGAGEIMIQSMDRDGTMTGYDIELLKRVQECSTVPVIAAGGAGNYEHLRQAFVETDVSAVACGSLFNFSDSSPLRAKAYLKNYGIPLKVI